MPQLNCLIVDDHLIFTRAMESLLTTFSNIGDIHVSSSVNHGLEIIKEPNHKIDVVFLDIHMPEINGLEAIKLIKDTNKRIKILVITSNIDPLIINKVIELGANAYLPKSCDIDDLKKALNSIESNQFYISPVLKNEIEDISNKLSQKYLNNEFKSSFNALSEREIEVIKMVAKGYNNREIAEKLFLSPLTVKTHRHNILQKLNLNNSAALIRFVTEMGLI